MSGHRIRTDACSLSLGTGTGRQHHQLQQQHQQQQQAAAATPPTRPTNTGLLTDIPFPEFRGPPAARRIPLSYMARTPTQQPKTGSSRPSAESTTAPTSTPTSIPTTVQPPSTTPPPNPTTAWHSDRTPAVTSIRRCPFQSIGVGTGDDGHYLNNDKSSTDTPRRPGTRQIRNRAGVPVADRDTPYRPDLLNSDFDDDDDYQEGLVAEPNPDLDTTMAVMPINSSPARQNPQAVRRVQDRDRLSVPGPSAGGRYTQPSALAPAPAPATTDSTDTSVRKRTAPATASSSKKPRTTNEQVSGAESRTAAGQDTAAAAPDPPSSKSPNRARHRATAGPPTVIIKRGSGSGGKSRLS